MNTNPVSKEEAVKAAKRYRDNNKEVCRVMMPYADEEQMWAASTDKGNIMARFILETHQGRIEANEEKAKVWRQQLAESGTVEGTREALAMCARNLDEYMSDAYPANEHGQVHFLRAVAESAADEIRAFLKNTEPQS